MNAVKKSYYEKRAKLLIKNLQKRHHEAYYCETKEQALEKALELIPEGASVGWGGAMTAAQIGLLKALCDGDYQAIDRNNAPTAEDRAAAERACLSADFFVTGANAMTLDGQMVNIDGLGNRVAAIIFGPKNVLIVAGMNKVCDTLEDAVTRARTVAAPMNMQRFGHRNSPCSVTGACNNCTSDDCICNQIVITRNGRFNGRMKFILIGEELGL